MVIWCKFHFLTSTNKIMNKSDIIKSIARENHYTQKDTGRIINAFIEATGIAVSKGHKVSIMGFGKFSVSKRVETRSYNPRTGKKIVIHPHNRITFKAGTNLKSSCNK